MWVLYVRLGFSEKYYFCVDQYPRLYQLRLSESGMMIPGTYAQMREDYD